MATPKVTPEQFASTVFDYIIVGGGTAGLVLATRLSEDPSKIVGVIEAGDWDPNVNAINIPGLCGSILGNPQYDWAFMSVPQKHANDRPVFQPREKAVGGSSMLNLLGYSRAAAHEYDAIEALGNPGWNWQEFLKYLKKTETTLPPSDIAKEQGLSPPDPKYHGDSGPIVKQYPTWFNPLHKSFLDTLEKLGVPRNADPDSGINMGGVTSFMTVDSNAVRTYSASSYYQPNAGRQNLVLLTNSKVAKINLREGTSPLRATGVDFISGEKRYTVSARKEVILAAGAFQTPQILELSGIGNKEILSKHGIHTFIGYDMARLARGGGGGVKDINPKMIYGKAQHRDTQSLAAKAQDEAKALELCRNKVRQKKLPMEVIDAEYQWDRRKLTFYFIAEKRIDFRELVRELFRLYKTRIWMASLGGTANYEQ
ncbi:hypothetical protein NUW54_g4388 [Trametes sanguinea]|uniref:Uncharacterized protein n=1 Tax=Trametes sanguinea TaxID=158606 RepID=A0ACC1PY41_9APHY|nr:hypothetical protein NUW54_g4388 [Trametes sanguinea]